MDSIVTKTKTYYNNKPCPQLLSHPYTTKPYFFYLTHTIYHISHITHNNQTLLGRTEFVKHGAEYDNGYSKYHEYIHKLSHDTDHLVANSKPLLYIICLYSSIIRRDFNFTRKLKKSIGMPFFLQL